MIRIVLFISLFTGIEIYGIASSVSNTISKDTFIRQSDVSYQYYLDKEDKYTITDMTRQEKLFSEKQSGVHNYGVTKGALWVKLNISNKNLSLPLFLQVGMPSLEEVTIYYFDNDRVTDTKTLREHDYSNRDIDHQLYHFSLFLPSSKTRTYILKIKSCEEIILPLEIGTRDQFHQDIKNFDIFYTIFASIFLTLILYNLFLFITVRDRVYLMYILYMFVLLFTRTHRHGYLAATFGFDSAWSATFLTSQLGPFIALSIFPFTITFLKLGKNHRVSYTLIWILFVWLFSGMVLGWFGLFHLARQVSMFGVLSGTFLVLYLAIIKVRQKHRPAYFFLFSWSIFMLNVCFYQMSLKKLFPYNDLVNFLPEIGGCIEGILLSFALADRINIINKEKQASQAKAISSQKKVEEILKDQKEKLEIEVAHRTKDLSLLNRELKRQALNAKINPHFVFNVLNSIQAYILMEEIDNADKYLSKLSKLMRFYLESSYQLHAPFEEELAALYQYLELEKIRFGKKLNYEVRIELDDEGKGYLVPVMIILPFLENSIWHGIVHKDEPGNLLLHIEKQGGNVMVIIQDDGIGYLQQPQKEKKENHHSHGQSLTKERMLHYCQEFGNKYYFEIKDLKEENSHGTRVTFSLPYKKEE